MAASDEKTKPQKKQALGRALVIGGCGFLGHHVVKLLVENWDCSAVSVLDLRCARNRRPDSDGVEYIEADITDEPKLVEIMKRLRPDVVIHTASPLATGTNVSNELFRRVNIDGTRSVVAACQQAGVKALVFTSSASIMSDNRSDLINVNETWPVIRGEAQAEYYSETKAEAESIVLAANRQEGFPLLTASIRPSGIFGEGDAQLVYQLIRIYEQGRTNVQVGDNTNLFDFTYAGNVAHAHLLAARALLVTAQAAPTVPLDHERVDGEAFLVTNGQPIYFWDFARAVWRAAGSDRGTDGVWVMSREVGLALGFLSEVFFAIIRKPPTFNRHRIHFSCMTRYYDIAKIRRRLGYEPIIAYSEAVRRSVQWTLDQKKAAGAKA